MKKKLSTTTKKKIVREEGDEEEEQETMRKIHCEEMFFNKNFNKLPLSDVLEMAGYYLPDDERPEFVHKWTVSLLDKHGYYDANTQFEAQVISELEMIKGLLLKLLHPPTKVGGGDSPDKKS